MLDKHIFERDLLAQKNFKSLSFNGFTFDQVWTENLKGFYLTTYFQREKYKKLLKFQKWVSLNIIFGCILLKELRLLRMNFGQFRENSKNFSTNFGKR